MSFVDYTLILIILSFFIHHYHWLRCFIITIILHFIFLHYFIITPLASHWLFHCRHHYYYHFFHFIIIIIYHWIFNIILPLFIDVTIDYAIISHWLLNINGVCHWLLLIRHIHLQFMFHQIVFTFHDITLNGHWVITWVTRMSMTMSISIK